LKQKSKLIKKMKNLSISNLTSTHAQIQGKKKWAKPEILTLQVNGGAGAIIEMNGGILDPS
jgi:hypothetical protein